MAFGDGRWRTIVRLRLRSLLHRADVESEMHDELRDHLDREISRLIEQGVPPDKARRLAQRSMGTLETVKEHLRETRRVGLVEDSLRDVQYAVRVLRRTPGFAIVAILSLALGIGANTAIFQLLDAVRLRSLPVERPRELAIVQIAQRGWPSGSYATRYSDFTYAQWERFKRDQQAFTQVLAWAHQTFDLADRGESRFAENGLWVSGGFFNVLGVRPAAGRLFTDEDDRRDCGAPGVVLSHAFWEREFGGRRDAIGETLTVQGRTLPVIGVSERSFTGVEVGRSFDFAVPLCAQPLLSSRSWLNTRDQWWLAVMGRRAAAVSLEQATASLQSISPSIFRETLPADYSADDATRYLAFQLEAVDGATGYSQLRDQYAVPLWILLSIAGLVLAIACANLANLLLARFTTRSREMSMRLAIGASRGRLARQLLIENLLLAGVGATLGAALAPLTGRLILAMIASDVSVMFLDVGVDWRMLGFASGLAILTCLLFGLAPVLRASRAQPGDALKAGGRTATAGRSVTIWRRALVAAQITLSLVLLAAGLLFGRSLINLLSVDAGFRQNDMLVAEVDVSRLGLSPEARTAFRRNLLDRLRALPDVEAAATVGTMPMVANNWRHFFIDGPASSERRLSRFNRVSERYFETLGTAFVSGRDFDERDTASSPLALIVNEAFVARHFENRVALGATVRLEGAHAGHEPGQPITIVGIVKNTKHGDLREEFPPIAYLSESQSKTPGAFYAFLIRSRTPASALRAPTSRTIEAVNANALFHFHDFQEQVLYTIRRDQLMASLCGFFAILGALLASIGVYGVTSYSVQQRTTDIGIRLALGATPRGIVRLVLRESIAIVAAGLAAGIVLALFASRAADGLVFGLAPRDPGTLVFASGLLAAIALLATLMPALRASRLDATTALRAE